MEFLLTICEELGIGPEVARFADGGMTNKVTPVQFREQWARIARMTREEGRNPDALGSALENHDEEGVSSDPHFGENNTFYLHAMTTLPTVQN